MSMSIQNNEVKSATRGRHVYISAATHERLLAAKKQFLDKYCEEHLYSIDDVAMDELIADLLDVATDSEVNEVVLSAGHTRELAELQRENKLLKAKLRAVGAIAGKPTPSTALTPFEAAFAAAGWEARSDFVGWYFNESTEEQLDEDDLRARLGFAPLTESYDWLRAARLSRVA